MPRVTPMTAGERDAYTRGRGGFASGDVDQALETLSTLLKSRSDLADVHYMVGVLRDRTGDPDGASESLRNAIRLNPGYAEALLALHPDFEGVVVAVLSLKLDPESARLEPKVKTDTHWRDGRDEPFIFPTPDAGTVGERTPG